MATRRHGRVNNDATGTIMAADAQNWPNLIFEKLREFDVRHVTYVPDSGHARLIELCHAANEIKPTVLTTEEERIGILAGAWLGGERGVLLMQSSGVGNCINTLSLARVCAFPLLMIVTMRGEWGEANPWQVPMGQIAADTLRLAGAIVYEVTDPQAAVATVEAAARIKVKPAFPPGRSAVQDEMHGVGRIALAYDNFVRLNLNPFAMLDQLVSLDCIAERFGKPFAQGARVAVIGMVRLDNRVLTRFKGSVEIGRHNDVGKKPGGTEDVFHVARETREYDPRAALVGDLLDLREAKCRG